MANSLMKYKGSRGSEYRTYVGKTRCICGEDGYLEIWYTVLGSTVKTIKHTKKSKTVKRCWG